MKPKFVYDKNFDVIANGMDWLEPPALAYLTVDRKLLKLEWPGGKVTYHLPETHTSVSFGSLEAAFYAAYGKEMS